jgi:hypothetical protein
MTMITYLGVVLDRVIRPLVVVMVLLVSVVVLVRFNLAPSASFGSSADILLPVAVVRTFFIFESIFTVDDLTPVLVAEDLAEGGGGTSRGARTNTSLSSEL